MANFKGVDPRIKDEKEFEKDARKAYLVPMMEAVAAAISLIDINAPMSVRASAVSGALVFWLAGINKERETLQSVTAKWAAGVDDYHVRRFVYDFYRVAGVDFSRVVRSNNFVAYELDKAIKSSVDLITTIPRRYHDDLIEGYRMSERLDPMNLEEREKLIRRVYQDKSRNAAYNLRRITRDQSNKLTGALSKARQESVGVSSYIWRTSGDDRVRESHRALGSTGKPILWSEPPPETGHPGEDIQCRCVAIPNISIDEIRRKAGVY